MFTSTQAMETDQTSASTVQSPFNLFGTNTTPATNIFNTTTTPATTNLFSNTTAANAAKTPLPTFSWNSNNTTPSAPPLFSNTNTTATTAASPFSFAVTPKAPTTTPTFTFQSQQQQSQKQQIINLLEQHNIVIKQLIERIYQHEQLLLQIGNHQQNPYQNSIFNQQLLPSYPVNYYAPPVYGVPNDLWMQQQCLLEVPGGRPSTLAVQCLQKAITEQQQSYRSDQDKLSLQPKPSHYDIIPTRKYGSTCIPDRDRRYCMPHLRPFELTRFSRSTDAWNSDSRGSTCVHPREKYHSPGTNNRFRANTSPYHRSSKFLSPLPNTYDKDRYESYYPSLQKTEDQKWKILNEKVAKESLLNSGRLPASKSNNGEPSCLWEIPDKEKSFYENKHCSKPDYRNRESRNIWDWKLLQRSVGPPIESYLTEQVDYRDPFTNPSMGLFRQRMNTVPEIVANLPGILTVRSGPTGSRIVKSRPYRSYPSHTHKAMKASIQNLYQSLQNQDSSNESIPLEKRTSSVFLIASKSGHQNPVQDIQEENQENSISDNSASSGTQTDKPSDDDNYFINRFLREQLNQGRPVQDGIHSQSQGETAEAPEPGTKSGVKLTGEGYYCKPNLATLDRKINPRDDTCYVQDFEVGHREHGKVVFPGFVDVTGLDLDKIVVFRPRELTLYPDDDDTGIKLPPFGQGLHNQCIVTLFNVWPTVPKGKGGQGGDAPLFIRNPEKLAEMNFVGRLKKLCEKFHGKFVGYDQTNGNWIFMAQMLPPHDD